MAPCASLFLFIKREIFTTHISGERCENGVPVVTGRQRAEAFLSGRVPNGQLHLHAVHVDRLCLEVHANGERLIGVEVVLGEAQHQTTTQNGRWTFEVINLGTFVIFSLIEYQVW